MLWRIDLLMSVFLYVITYNSIAIYHQTQRLDRAVKPGDPGFFPTSNRYSTVTNVFCPSFLNY